MRARCSIVLLGSLSLVTNAWSQAFQFAPGQIPQGGPANDSASENVDFADVDLDGDFDCAFADGGDVGNDQNRLWLNQGGVQGGTVGFFGDATAVRFPMLLDSSRDVEFGDIDGDLDLDVAIANDASISNQGLRVWMNQGGIQGGQVGFFQDVTSTAFQGLGNANSSVNPAFVLPAGNYICWSGDVEFGDLDGDGDLDLIVTEYGSAFSGMTPTRMFLNSGLGVFTELNPTGSSGAGGGLPGIWCEGIQVSNTLNSTGQQCDVTNSGPDGDLADIDGDLDLDFLLGNLSAGDPRFYHNRMAETGATIFRDVTGAVFPPDYATSTASYEQELADMDNDGDIDVWGLSWVGSSIFLDITLRNSGNGTLGELTTVAGSGADEEEIDFLDYDNDGDLDTLAANFSGSELLYRNDLVAGNYSFTNVTSGNIPASPSVSKDADVCDIDGDGDYDAIVANLQANELLKNVTQVADTHAPRLSHLEQVPNRVASSTPTRVRVQNHGNAAYYVAWYDSLAVEYSVNGGAFQSVNMRTSQGNVFYGEIPGLLVGTIAYRVQGQDRYGNASTTGIKSFVASGNACSGSLASYCNSKVNSLGCRPAVAFDGYPSVAAGSGFEIRATNVLQNVNGLFFYSTTGADNAPFLGGSLCAAPPLTRTGIANSLGASACGGVLALDFNAWIAAGSDPALVAGQAFWGQFWYRDPASTFTVGLSNAITGTICP